MAVVAAAARLSFAGVCSLAVSLAGVHVCICIGVGGAGLLAVDVHVVLVVVSVSRSVWLESPSTKGGVFDLPFVASSWSGQGGGAGSLFVCVCD